MNITFKNTKYDIKKYNERTSYDMIRRTYVWYERRMIFYFTKRYYDTTMYNENRVFKYHETTSKTSVPLTCRVPLSLFARLADCFAIRLPN